MPNFERLSTMTDKALQRLSSFQWLAALLMRLFVGYFFFETGWAKLHNLNAFTARFMQWGIPHPAFNAALSAYTECIGGALTVLGLGMRFVSIPMMINMAVAIINVKMKNVASLDDFVELDEPLYALAYFWLMISGAGWISIDGLIRQTFRGVGRKDEPSRSIESSVENGDEQSSSATTVPVSRLQ